ncbi:MAG: o-succinylbenzoate synthase [Marinifilaceae bacterium]
MPYRLQFKEAGGTSRGILTTKETYFVKVWDSVNPSCYGIGEAALFRGLSAEDCPEYEETLANVCRNIDTRPVEQLTSWSSIRFGLETALADLRTGGIRTPYPSDFTRGERTITINGLIWMGTKETMRQRIEDKLNEGFRCLKLKIGAIDFNAELELLHEIRAHFSPCDVELRVDANGAFTPAEAPRKLEQLSAFNLHSIEQPIRAGQWKEMAALVSKSPIPIALDEELIGVSDAATKQHMLETIRPHYIILKPALCGGFAGSEEWIRLASALNIGHWATSALESNIGLNAIAQWCATHPNVMPQGLGTGQLYTNNIPSPLYLSGAELGYNPTTAWEFT